MNPDGLLPLTQKELEENDPYAHVILNQVRGAIQDDKGYIIYTEEDMRKELLIIKEFRTLKVA